MSSITRINRDDMLELTRRMTIARTSMTRIAGSYMDADGFIDGTFNTNFLKLKNSEKENRTGQNMRTTKGKDKKKETRNRDRTSVIHSFLTNLKLLT